MKPILATIIFAEELSEERGPQAIIGEAEQSDAISTGATCACILEIEQFRNNNIGEELQYECIIRSRSSVARFQGRLLREEPTSLQSFDLYYCVL